MDIFKELVSVATVELVFCIVVFKLILSNYHPPIQQAIQAAICVVIAVILAMVTRPTVESFMLGIICAGLGFYGGTYVDELRVIKKELTEDDER